MIKAIIFDLSETLISTSNFFKNNSIDINYKIFQKHGFKVTKNKIKQALKNVYKKEEEIWKKNVPFFKVLANELNIKITKKKASEMDNEFRNFFLKIIKIRKDAKNLIKELSKRGYILGIISEYDIKTSKEIIKKFRLEKYFKIVIGLENGYLKKTGNPYRTVIRKLKIKPKEILMVGDKDYEDVIVPKSLGLNALKFGSKKIKKLKDILELCMGIKAVIFDFGSTLFDGSSIKYMYERVSLPFWKKHGFKGTKTEFFNALKKTEKEFSKIGLRDRKHLYKYSEILSRNLGVKVPKSVFIEEFNLTKNYVYKYVKPFKETERLLKNLKVSGYKLGLVSNSWREFVLPLLKKYGLEKYFDAIVISDMVGAIKQEMVPIFKCAEKLGISPEAILVVDDDKSVSVCEKYGFKFFHLKNNKSLVKISEYLKFN